MGDSLFLLPKGSKKKRGTSDVVTSEGLLLFLFNERSERKEKSGVRVTKILVSQVIMPINRGRDSTGPFYRWGNQKRYYYISGDAQSREKAKAKAYKQAKAIYASGYSK